MFLLKALLFLLLNLGMGFLLVITLRALLFYPDKKKYIGTFPVPFTPALIYRLKNYVIKYLHDLLSNFLQDCQNIDKESKIKEIENSMYDKMMKKLEFIDSYYFIPQVVRLGLKSVIAQLLFELTRYFIRTFIPYLIERYSIEGYIELLEKKADISILTGYYNRYVHRYLLYVTLSFFFFTGIFNMLIYLIIR
jgi:uncharacterized membrane protein YheB (UPF0754 family)